MRRSVFLCVAVAVAAALLCARPTEAGLLEDVQNALSKAWGSVWGAVTGLAQAIECKAVDWAAVTLTPCLQAPDTNLCTADCKANLDALRSASQSCIDRLLKDVAKTGNVTATTRWENQLKACNITYNPPNAAVAAYGSVLLPLAVVAASMVVLEALLHP